MNAKYDKIEPIKQDKRDGIIRDLSEKTGLIVHAFEITKIAI